VWLGNIEEKILWGSSFFRSLSSVPPGVPKGGDALLLYHQSSERDDRSQSGQGEGYLPTRVAPLLGPSCGICREIFSIQ
jgi:hypothetical protein